MASTMKHWADGGQSTSSLRRQTVRPHRLRQLGCPAKSFRVTGRQDKQSFRKLPEQLLKRLQHGLLIAFVCTASQQNETLAAPGLPDRLTPVPTVRAGVPRRT